MAHQDSWESSGILQRSPETLKNNLPMYYIHFWVLNPQLSNLSSVVSSIWHLPHPALTRSCDPHLQHASEIYGSHWPLFLHHFFPQWLKHCSSVYKKNKSPRGPQKMSVYQQLLEHPAYTPDWPSTQVSLAHRCCLLKPLVIFHSTFYHESFQAYGRVERLSQRTPVYPPPRLCQWPLPHLLFVICPSISLSSQCISKWITNFCMLPCKYCSRLLTRGEGYGSFFW